MMGDESTEEGGEEVQDSWAIEEDRGQGDVHQPIPTPPRRRRRSRSGVRGSKGSNDERERRGGEGKTVIVASDSDEDMSDMLVEEGDEEEPVPAPPPRSRGKIGDGVIIKGKDKKNNGKTNGTVIVLDGDMSDSSAEREEEFFDASSSTALGGVGEVPFASRKALSPIANNSGTPSGGMKQTQIWGYFDSPNNKQYAAADVHKPAEALSRSAVVRPKSKGGRWDKREIDALMLGLRKYPADLKSRWKKIQTDPAIESDLVKRSNWDLRDKCRALVVRLARLFLALSNLNSQGLAFATPAEPPAIGWRMSEGAEALLSVDIADMDWSYVDKVQAKIDAWNKQMEAGRTWMKVPPPTPEQGGLSNRQLGQRRRQENFRAEKMKMAAVAAVEAQKVETAVGGTVGRNVGSADALAGKGGNSQAGEAGGCEMGRGGMLGFCLWKVVSGPVLLPCYIIAALCILLEFVQYLRFKRTTAQKGDVMDLGDDIGGDVRGGEEKEKVEEEEEEEEAGETRARGFYCGDIYPLVEAGAQSRMTTTKVRDWFKTHPKECKDFSPELYSIVARLEEYDIDHIVPRKLGGHDHIFNFYIMPKKLNQSFGGLAGRDKMKYIGKRVTQVASRFARYCELQSRHLVDYGNFSSIH